jgi:cell division protein FtsL
VILVYATISSIITPTKAGLLISVLFISIILAYIFYENYRTSKEVTGNVDLFYSFKMFKKVFKKFTKKERILFISLNSILLIILVLYLIIYFYIPSWLDGFLEVVRDLLFILVLQGSILAMNIRKRFLSEKIYREEEKAFKIADKVLWISVVIMIIIAIIISSYL